MQKTNWIKVAWETICPPIKFDDRLDPSQPILKFERIAHRLGFKKWYLYPIPIIALYSITSVIPHWYSMNSDVWWKIHYNDFSNTLGWLILIIAVSYGTVFFRKTMIGEINRLFNDGIIDPNPKDPNDQKIIFRIYNGVLKNALHGKTIFAFLVLFELLVGFFWYYDIQDGKPVLSESEFVLQIPGTMIMIFVLLVAAEIFTIAIAGALLPYRLEKYINVKPLHMDHHGGLKPFGNIMLVMEYVYVGGLAISFIAFEEFRSTPILFGLFIGIMSALIITPQINLYKKLSRAKTSALAEIQAIYFLKKPNSETNKILPKWEGSGIIWPFDASYLTYVKMAKDEVELMKTLSFDLITLYKAISLSIGLPFVSSFIQNIPNNMPLP